MSRTNPNVLDDVGLMNWRVDVHAFDGQLER
jgi:hypothetical protein